jgi:hypothetical protein
MNISANFATSWVVLADKLAFFMSIKIFIITVGTPTIERRVSTNTFYFKRLSKKVLHILRASNYKKLKLVTIQHNKVHKDLGQPTNL